MAWVKSGLVRNPFLSYRRKLQIKPEQERRNSCPDFVGIKSSGADFVGIKNKQRASAEIYYLLGLKILQ